MVFTNTTGDSYPVVEGPEPTVNWEGKPAFRCIIINEIGQRERILAYDGELAE